MAPPPKERSGGTTENGREQIAADALNVKPGMPLIQAYFTGQLDRRPALSGMVQRLAFRPHKPEIVGSSPAPAIATIWAREARPCRNIRFARPSPAGRVNRPLGKLML